MRVARLIATIVLSHLARGGVGLTALLLIALPALLGGAGASTGLAATWLAGSAGTLSLVGSLIGLYIGLIACSLSAYVLLRVPPADSLRVRGGILLVFTGLFGLAALLGASLAGSVVSSTAPFMLWTAVLLTCLGLCAQALLRKPTTQLLTTVLLCWWIPAILPPSLLHAWPRGLRAMQAGSDAGGLPHGSLAWAADTALVMGLLLVAWLGHQRAVRVDEVRDPG